MHLSESRRRLLVQKYGGSSVATLDRLERIAHKIASDRERGPVVVVVSAMGGSTEQLLGLAEQAADVSESTSIPARELDMLVSTGERVTMALLAIILQGLGVSARSLTGSQAGIITSNSHFDARVVGVRPKRIESALESGEVVVVAGYQGVSESGEITTLGRGGSDTTAVALAARLDAERCEIYSDVDGVYSADPRRVERAHHLPLVGYRFVHELSCAGARVLNPRAVELAARSQVDLRARSSFDESPTPRETRVTDDERCPPCRAVVEQPDVAVVCSSAECRAAVVAAAQRAGFELLDLTPTAGGWQAWVRLDAVNRRLLKRLSNEGFQLSERQSVVSLVDSAFSRTSETAPHALSLLPDSAGLLAQHRGRLSVRLPRDEAAALVLSWHDALVAPHARLKHSA